MPSPLRRKLLFRRLRRRGLYTAANLPSLAGGELLVNPGFDAFTAWWVTGGWGIDGGIASTTSGGSIGQNGVAAAGGWYQVGVSVASINGTLGLNLGGSTTRTVSASGIHYATHRAGTATLQFDASGSAGLHSASLWRFNQASLYDLEADSLRDGTFDANVTVAAGYQAGIGALDSKTNPQHGWLAYLAPGQARVFLDELVGGAWLNVLSVAIAYGAARQLRVVRANTSFSLYYDGAPVGSTTTIGDLPWLNYFGGFRTDAGAVVANIRHQG